jgi:hypothetical protein
LTRLRGPSKRSFAQDKSLILRPVTCAVNPQSWLNRAVMCSGNWWRRVQDSNLRHSFECICFQGRRVEPLPQLSTLLGVFTGSNVARKIAMLLVVPWLDGRTGYTSWSSTTKVRFFAEKSVLNRTRRDVPAPVPVDGIPEPQDLDRISFSCAVCRVTGIILSVGVNSQYVLLEGHCPTCGRKQTALFSLAQINAYLLC